MEYKREIDDSALIQFIILYTLSKADTPLAYNNLINLIMDNCNINYSDFQVGLVNLTKTNHIRAHMEGKHNQIYSLTEKGGISIDRFKRDIPIYIREPIDNSVKEMYLSMRRENAVTARIIPLKDDDYLAELALCDDDKTELMRLTLYAGTREQAEKMAVYFKKHPELIYGGIIEAFEKEE